MKYLRVKDSCSAFSCFFSHLLDSLCTEAGILLRCSLEKVFFTISQKFTRKHPYQNSSLQLYHKKYSNTSVFLQILQNFPERFFFRTPSGDFFCLYFFHIQENTIRRNLMYRSSFTYSFGYF